MPKLVLLDAYALIYRAYYGLIRSPRINSQGQNTSAVFGFVNTLEEILRSLAPDYLAVCFDPAGPTFRHEMYPEYKAQREATPEDIRWAVPQIKRIVEAYSLPLIEVAGFEADDVIGTLAKTAEREGFEVFMITPDKDYAQLVSPHITMCRPAAGGGNFEELGVREVCEKYGIEQPEQVIDLLGLMGDTADNIPGCPGVGEKTAAKLIGQFGSIENLLEHTDQLKGAQRKKVEEHVEQIRFSKFLATIKTDVPLDFGIDSLRFQEKNKEALRGIFEELEFRTLIARILDTDKGNSKSANEPDLFASQTSVRTTESSESTGDLFSDNFDTLESRPHDYQLIDTEKEAEELLSLIHI